jgi:peptidoglycan/LPS O-acetylase OafA/YrhL
VTPPTATLVRPATTSGEPARRADSTVGLRKFRPDIQGLRAISVLLVVLYHADVPYVRAGYVGVDVFFVISGFLITGALLREVDRFGHISFLAFYAGRTRRLLLPAAVMVLVTLVATRAWVSVFQIKDVTTDAVWSTFYAINYRLAAQGIDYQQSTAPPSPLQHMWSLAVEEQFYVGWPVIIMLCVLVARRKHLLWMLVPVLALITTVSFYFSVTDTVKHPPMAYFSIHTRAWELAVGALVYLAAAKLARLPAAVAAAASWVGVIGIVGSAFYFSDDTAFPGSAATLPVLSAALVIAAGCRPSRGGAEKLLDRGPFQALGKVSYSWYLWHWPLVILVPLFAGYPFNWELKMEVMVLALWVAVLMYYLVEAPTQRAKIKRPTWLGVGALTSATIIGVCSLVALSVPTLVGSGKAAATMTLGAANTTALKSALVAGLKVEQAPRNLTPSIANSRNDQPISSKNGCHANYPAIEQGTCVFGEPQGLHTLVLVGDSHAQQWLPAFDKVGKALHWKVISWTKAACPIATVTVTTRVLGRAFTECNAWRDKTLAKIRLLKPDLVVMSQSDLVPGTQFSNSQWADATVTTVNRIRSNGTPIVFIMDTPVPSGNVPDCVARHLSSVSKCNFPRANSYRFAGRHEQVKASLKLAKVTTVEPIDLFCSTTACPVVVGNLLVYRDEAHISTPYSRWLAPMVTPLFIPRGTS